MTPRRVPDLDVCEFVGTDGNTHHLVARTVGGDGNYEQEAALHEGPADTCPTCDRWRSQ